MLLTADFDWRLKLEEDRLLHEDLSSGLTEQTHVLLLDCYALAVTIYQLVDETVNIELARHINN